MSKNRLSSIYYRQGFVVLRSNEILIFVGSNIFFKTKCQEKKDLQIKENDTIFED